MIHAMNRPAPLLITLVGCTAVGKTDLAIQLARRLGGEIIGADSRQIYRYMDIGTAKPTPEERVAAPHHLVDFVDPDEEFSLARYQDLASAAIEAILARGHQPLLVGGTGQYLQAMLEGWNVPRVAPQPELRAALAAEAEQVGVEALFQRLAVADPVTAGRIGPTNLRRIIRALEVLEVSGEPISTQQTKTPPPYRRLVLWLDLPREVLYERIDRRVDQMMGMGLLDELHGLQQRGYGWELPAMSSLGYREFQPWFAGAAALETCVQTLKWNTHAFARRQIAWFKRLPDQVKIEAGPAALDHALALVGDRLR
jgi:tRNA dimethylallyltransferase